MSCHVSDADISRTSAQAPSALEAHCCLLMISREHCSGVKVALGATTREIIVQERGDMHKQYEMGVGSGWTVPMQGSSLAIL